VGRVLVAERDDRAMTLIQQARSAFDLAEPGESKIVRAGENYYHDS
jgi:hypothetical protein